MALDKIQLEKQYLQDELEVYQKKPAPGRPVPEAKEEEAKLEVQLKAAGTKHQAGQRALEKKYPDVFAEQKRGVTKPLKQQRQQYLRQHPDVRNQMQASRKEVLDLRQQVDALKPGAQSQTSSQPAGAQPPAHPPQAGAPPPANPPKPAGQPSSHPNPPPPKP
jgi:hypothetical protein